MRRTFQQTKSAGSVGEERVVSLLRDAGMGPETNRSFSKSELLGWDVVAFLLTRNPLSNVPVYFEVKFDQMATRTGNLAVEYYNVRQGKPSGIDSTTADVWAVVLQSPDQVWFASTAALRRYVAETRPLREIACGGDDNAAMKLYRKSDILPAVFHRADGLAPWETVELVRTLKEASREPAAVAA